MDDAKGAEGMPAGLFRLAEASRRRKGPGALDLPRGGGNEGLPQGPEES
ncbi:MAG: hypothetical protein M5T61_06405 [Acidimicrobiia bacterium]|nr:hypothetical protein [Acidimicrobiia bacterium]